ncbi:MAG: gamma-glutamylcyclotransferase [Defluviimonas sp.]|nr:gamma-glutamylcyclotransferase [Defluviimonas sp.]
MATIHYFAYGSNMLTERLRARCASAKSRHVAYAHDWTLTFSKRSQDGSGKATISPAAGRRVFGVVFNLDESELSELDRFEGVGKGYDRKDDFLVHIADSKEPLNVVTYIANPSHIDTNLEPFDWYLSLVVIGTRQHKFPPEYASSLEATPSKIDPKTDRESRREALELLGMKPLPDDTRIAGKKTVADWTAMRDRLTRDTGPAPWKDAFDDFFKTRLESRYFGPIRAIEKLDENAGEGFAIVALHCSLIEFLAATLKGKTYKYQRRGKPPLGPFEYSNSSDMFIEFLESAAPFKTMFSKAGTALNFYRSVRCGLLHEARTKGNWKIRVCESATRAIDVEEMVVCRNKMQEAFDQFVDWYGRQLPIDTALQQAFIRKFDSLCQE